MTLFDLDVSGPDGKKHTINVSKLRSPSKEKQLFDFKNLLTHLYREFLKY